jgi:hypothetical protein
LIVCFTGILYQNHIDFPDTHLVHVLILVFLHKGGNLPQQLIETHCVYKETLIEAINFRLWQTQVGQGVTVQRITVQGLNMLGLSYGAWDV